MARTVGDVIKALEIAGSNLEVAKRVEREGPEQMARPGGILMVIVLLRDELRGCQTEIMLSPKAEEEVTLLLNSQ